MTIRIPYCARIELLSERKLTGICHKTLWYAE